MDHVHVKLALGLRSERVVKVCRWAVRPFFRYFFHDLHVRISYSSDFFSIFSNWLGINYFSI